MRYHFMVILLLAVHSISSKEICKVGDVYLSTIFGYESKNVISATFSGEIEVFEIENVTNSYFKDSKYLEVKMFPDEKLLKIVTTEAFKKYEEEETSLRIQADWIIECDNGEEDETIDMSYYQRILEENKYTPQFSADRYDFVFYGDLPKGFDLNEILPFYVYDKDISTSNLHVSITKNDELSVSSGYIENKMCDVELSAKKTIVAPFKGEYTLTVTDGIFATDIKNSTAPLTLRVEKLDGSIEFEKSEYKARLYDAVDLKLEEFIKLKNGIDALTKFEIRSDYKEYFSVSIDVLRGAINVKTKKALPLPRNYKTIEIYLDAYWRGLEASTKIVIDSEKEIAKLCYVYGMDLEDYFHEYRGPVIAENHTGVITEFDVLNVDKVECTGEKEKYISCEIKENKLVISVTKEFENYEENETKSRIKLDMKIHCPYDVVTMEYTQVIEDINTHDPLFEREKYEYIFYNEVPSNMYITDLQPVIITDGDFGNVAYSCQTEDGYINEYIGTTMGGLTGKSGRCALNTRQTMSPGFEKEIILLSSDGQYPPRTSQTIISIKVVEDREQLQFTRSEINAVLNNGVIDVVQLENGLDSATTFNLRSEYQDYFRVYKNVLKNKVEIIEKKNVSEIGVDVIRLILEVEWKGITDTTTIYLYTNGLLPTTTPLSTYPEETHTTTPYEPKPTTQYPGKPSLHKPMRNFNTWILTFEVMHIVVASVFGVIFCGLLYTAWRYYF